MPGKAFLPIPGNPENESIEIVPGKNAPCFFADARPDAIPGQKDPEGHLFFPRLPVPGFPQKPIAQP